jgi:PAS domain S-box-containing protein
MTANGIPVLFNNRPLIISDFLESETIYQQIFEHSIPTIVIGEDNTILLVNGKFEEISGYSRGEIETKKQWTEFIDKADIGKTLVYLAESRNPDVGWAPIQYVFNFINRNHQVTNVWASISLIAATKKIVVTIDDITPRKNVERLLRINEDRYQLLVKNLRTGVFRAAVKPPGRFIWANPAFLLMFGYGSLSELQKIPTLTLYAEAKDGERIVEDIRTGKSARYEKVRLRKNDGTLIWASITAEVEKNDDGTPKWVDGTVDDITLQLHIEEDLRRAHSRFGELLNAVTTYGIFGTDTKGTLTIFNSGSERLLGYKAEDLIGKETPLLFLCAPEVAARGYTVPEDQDSPPSAFETFVSRVQAEGCDEREWTYVRKDGLQIPVDLSLTVMRNGNGEITGYLGVARDISDRKRLEMVFRYNKIQMSGVIYNIPEPTFAIDRAGRVIAWNRAIEEMSGVKAMDILEKGNHEYSVPFFTRPHPMLLDLIFLPDEEIAKQGYTAITRKENSVAAESLIIQNGGNTRVIREVAAPIYNDTGEVAGSIESITDITEEELRKSDLMDSESRFRAILDYSGSAVALIEEDSSISYINPEFERIIGYVSEEIVGKKKWTEFVAPEDLKSLTDYQRRRRTDPSGLPVKYEFRFIRWDGQSRNGLLTITPIPGTGRTVVFLLDITDKVQAEEAIRRASKMTEFLFRHHAP